ncbi:putative tRNA modification GTPase TrmE [Babesia divergens]|uniref:tRNA modification GTPase TrmE n=1 Tax=Babesia divergens TaxID=32595 RepID=A0AAD9GI14_BABDI|nr:putative tRNA modification GTPase TrmE [Babesia divergens]
MGAIGTISRCFIGLVLLLNRLAGAWKATHPNTVALRSNTRRYAGVLRGHGDGHTVYGLCSAIPDGGCGVAITRISGQQSRKVLEILTTKQGGNASEGTFKCTPRIATLRNIYTPAQETHIDKAITIYFQAPNSFTGEDVVEIHTHGSKAIISQLFETLRQIASRKDISLRQAERGEFTRRAFYNGKLDLTQAEALRDVIGAETKLSMQNALLKLQGGLTQIYQMWAQRLNKVLAMVEAKIDFEEQAATDIRIAKHEADVKIVQKIEDNKGEILSSAINVALIGPPNAGKSTLINTICNRDVAIVANMPGTTRDVLQTAYDLHGIKLNVIDTAGIRTLSDNTKEDSHLAVEMQGIRRALQRLNDVELAIFLYDHTNMVASQEALDIALGHLPKQSYLILCLSKADLLDQQQRKEMTEEIKNKLPAVNTSICALSNLQINTVDALLEMVHNRLTDKVPAISTEPVITDARHKSHLRNVVKEIQHTLANIESQQKDLEIIAENIREAITQIGYIVGEQTNEQVLDSIFQTFCIGK